jgi:hypothetical protein
LASPLDFGIQKPKPPKPKAQKWYGGELNSQHWELGLYDNKPVFWTIQSGGILVECASLLDEKNNLIFTIPKKIPWKLPNVSHLKNELKLENLEWDFLYSEIKRICQDQLFILDEEYYDIIALFIILSYYQEQIQVAPYLLFLAEKISGKTTALKLLAKLCYRGVLYQDISEAALVRELQNKKITPLIDEAKEEYLDIKGLKSVLLNGTVRGMNYTRVSEKDMQDTDYWDVFGLKVLASPEPYSDHLASRCITINMTLGKSPKTIVETDVNKLLSVLYYKKLEKLQVTDDNVTINSIESAKIELKVTDVTDVTDINNNNNNNNTMNKRNINTNKFDLYNSIEDIDNPRVRDILHSLTSVTSVTSVTNIMEKIKIVAQKLVTDIVTGNADSTDAKILEVYCELGGNCSASDMRQQLILPPYSLTMITNGGIGKRLKAFGFTQVIVKDRNKTKRMWSISDTRLNILLKTYGLEDVKLSVNETLNNGEANGGGNGGQPGAGLGS